MKNRRINIKQLIRSLYKKYGSSDIFPLLIPYAEGLNGKIIYRDFYEAVKKTVSPHYMTDPEMIAKSIGRNTNYKALSHFYSYAVIAALSALNEAPPTEGLLAKTVEYLKSLYSLEVDELYYELSESERILNESKYFKDCDTDTKNECRRRVTSCSKKHKISEIEAATLFLTRDPFENESKIASRLYFPVLGIMTAIFSIISLIVTKNPAFFFFVLLPMSEGAKQLTDYIFSHLVKAAPIPKKKLTKLPDNAKTLTVITSLLTGKESDLELPIKIRNCAYANKDSNAVFGLLCDLKESDSPTSPTDKETIKKVADAVDEINGKNGTNILLFIRDRRFSPSEDKYMGWERKRGAIIELTRLLKGKETSIKVLCGDVSRLRDVKYVITLDSDTRLYTGAVNDLVGAMVHPSNTPITEGGKVVKGHAILQPRMEPSLLSTEKTPYTVLTSDGSGDIYAAASYETYQSIFGEGIFCGKGIFDLDAYSVLIDGAFPDGAVLSHDLLEGSRLRAGAVTDIVLTDDIPKSPLSCFERSHRWIRGDIQALAFAGKYIKDENGKQYRNPISRLSVYKLYDNARRALTPIFAFCALLLCIFRPPELSPYIALLSLAHIIIPFVLSILGALKGIGRRFFSHLIPASLSALLNLIYSISSLIHTALRNADAILRAGYRILFSRKKLLEWKTAADSEGIKGLPLVLYSMLPSMMIGLSLLIFCPRPPLQVLGGLTFLFPFACHLLGKPFKEPEKMSESSERLLREYAADSWKFFSERVSKEDNYLPPDNIQFTPDEKVAHRTSPTNIGLYLLSVCAAAKLKLINEKEALSCIDNTLNTVLLLPKWEGHLYNWYDTETLFILGQSYISSVDSGNFITSLVALKELLASEFESDSRLPSIIAKAEKLIYEADFSKLYNEKKKLMLIGINPEKPENDPPCYDFFPSEARTTSFYAIARGDIPREHWKYLRRIPTVIGGYTALASWTGTAFEYLMPSLITPTIKGSLSYEAILSAIREQKRTLCHGVWGRSESGYFDFDRDLNYQYKAFGVQSLAIKNGMDKDRVVSPYSSFLALPFDRIAAISNLKRLKRKGMYGEYGFYEALDMTHERVGNGYAIIKSQMAHHVGMSLIAIANACLGNIFVKAFMSDPDCASALELLTEKVPKTAYSFKRKKAISKIGTIPEPLPHLFGIERRAENHSATLLSESGASAVMIGDMLRLSALKSEITLDPFMFGKIYRPRLIMSVDNVVFDLMSGRQKDTDGKISRVHDTRRFVSEMSLSLLPSAKSFVISVSAEGSFKTVTPMLVLFPSLASNSERLLHPTYSDIMVESEYCEAEKAILFKKRAKREEDGEKCFTVSYESGGGGESFILGREYLPEMFSEKDIEALINAEFDNKTGAFSEPFCAVKKTSQTNGKYLLNILITVGRSKEEALSRLAAARKEIKGSKGKNGANIAEKLMKADRGGGVLSITNDERAKALLSEILRSILIPKKRVPKTSYTVNDFYKHGISGDNPIMTVKVGRSFSKSSPEYKWLKLFVLCHKQLNLSGIKLDTVILYDSGGEYMSGIKTSLIEAVNECASGFFLKGSIYLIDGEGDRDLFENTASVLAELDTPFTLDSFAAKNRAEIANAPQPITVPSKAKSYPPKDAIPVYGGYFTDDGFVLNKSERGDKKLPHSYVYALNHFGTLVTDNSLGYTWIGNSHERRITPFLPDLRRHLDGERIIATVADTEYDLIACSHTVSYKRGCAVWEGNAGPISYTVTAAIDTKLPCKAVTVTYHTEADIKTEYRIRPVLGDIERRNRPIKVTERDGITLYTPTVSGECSDTAFLLRKDFGGTHCFLLGAYPTGADKVLDTIINKYQARSDFERMPFEYENKIDTLLPKIKLTSPDRYLSPITEYYLPYQSLVCRFFGRTGFYQSGGAYGFRDQLQDCLSIMLSAPKIARNHLLRCACRQYEEGDVNHWWHVIRGVCRGVRTRYSDDLLWLPFVASRYAFFTGDYDIFDIELPYISSPPLRENERDRYECPSKSKYRSSFYIHCVKAIERSLEVGAHGLALMHGGDWNDGMNNIGEGGESIWLSMFISEVLDSFAPIAAKMGDLSGASKYRSQRDALLSAVEKCFDGEKYLRAFFGDGKSVGGDGFIDLLPQAFSVFAKCDEKASKIALKTAFKSLFSPEKSRFLLLKPPFLRPSERDVGYISSYPPGVRENGGQYTHAAAWAIMAMAEIGMNSEAIEALTAINPASICSSREGSERYRGEPYFLAGDVSGADGFDGRCGWSIYTGSASWMFNAIMFSILGIAIEADSFTVTPTLSRTLPCFTAVFDHLGSTYEIVAHIGSKTQYILDGKIVNNLFYFDKNYHLLEITVEISDDME